MIRSVINKIVDDSESELYNYLTGYCWYFDKTLCGGNTTWELLCQDHKLDTNDTILTNLGIYSGEKDWCVYRHGLRFTTRSELYNALQNFYRCDDPWIECASCPYADTCKVPALVSALIPLKTVYTGDLYPEHYGAECVYGRIIGTDIEVSQDEVLTVEQPVCDD